MRFPFTSAPTFALLFAVSVSGQNAEPSAVGEQGAAPAPAPAAGAGPSITGYIDATYVSNFNRPENSQNPLVYYQPRNATFLLDAAHLALEGTEGAASYRIDLDAGSDSRYSPGSLGAGGKDLAIDLQQAYVSYMFTPVFGARAGKCFTYEGTEVLASGANATITRGLLFGFAEPVAHVGAEIIVDPVPGIDLRLGAVNGWDLWEDNNDYPTVYGKAGFAGWEPVSVTASAYYGPEKADNTSDQRLSLDLIATVKATSAIDVNLQANYGREDAAAVDEAGDIHDASWFGAGIQPVLHLGKFQVGARYEIFSDAYGARTGLLPGKDLLAQTFAVSPGVHLTPNALLRVEGRLDIADQDVFQDSDGAPTGTQFLGAAELFIEY